MERGEATTGGPAPLGHPGLSWTGDGSLRPRPVGAAGEHRSGGVLHRTYRPEQDGALPDARLATFNRRAGGFAIDLGVQVMCGQLIAFVLTLQSGGDTDAVVGQVVFAIQLFGFGYDWVFSALGWSPGKRVVGLRIVTADGQAPGASRGFARAIGALVSELAFLIGYFWAAWDGRRQTWHDKIAGTYVVYHREAEATAGGPHSRDR
ncbi:MAG: hypothetical protein GEU80_03855 [Dehalococcoidia bacterium]|nr:hypothetical protein [Dehalococcoidia bacterium]